MNKSQAIILSAGPNGLGAIRSLYKENIQVDVIAINADDPSLLSRLAINKKSLSSPFNEQELLTLLMNWPVKGLVLIPTSDLFVNFLHQHQQALSSLFKFVLPPGNISSLLIDKKQEVELIAPWVSLPKTVITLPETAAELQQQLGFPLIIKPRSNELNHLQQKNITIYTPEQLTDFYQKFSTVTAFCIAQELIEGEDSNLWVCNCTFDKNSQLINAFTFQRLQLTPPHFGVTCYAESKYNPVIIEQVAKLGTNLQYIGPAMVEFKFDPKDGLYKYIEINPRLGLCNYFDSSCNKNNVYATYCVALGKKFIEKPQQNGRIFISLYEDLYSRYRDQQSMGTIATRYIKDLFKAHTFIYFSWQDPMPAIVMAYRQVNAIFTSLMRKITKITKR